MLDVDFRKLVGTLVAFAVGLLICILLELTMGSCTRKVYVPVETVMHDTTAVMSVSVDTVLTHDSVFVKVSGDTVYYQKYKLEYRYRWKRDTCYIAKTDTVAKPYKVETTKEVIPGTVWKVMGGMVIVIAVMGIYIWIRSKT